MKEIKVKVYEFNILDKIYYVYVNKNEEDNITEFYIQAKGYGIIDFMIGFNLEKENEENIEKYIKSRINEWVNLYNEEFMEEE